MAAKNEIVVVDTTDTTDKTDTEAVKSRDGGYLPPIYRLKMPKTTTKSALIRWLWALGYDVKTISGGLDIRYQQVRNIITTQPKRAAREDMPELEVEVLPVEDVVDALLGTELDRTFKADKKQKERAVKAVRRGIEPQEPQEPSDEEMFGEPEDE